MDATPQYRNDLWTLTDDLGLHVGAGMVRNALRGTRINSDCI